MRRAFSIMTFSAVAVAATFVVGAKPSEERSDQRAREIREALSVDAAAPYRIHAIRLGAAEKAPRHLFIADPALPRHIAVTFSLWVVVGSGRVILVDTGFFNKTMIEKWGIDAYRSPIQALEAAGIDRHAVTDVVVTHGHWDHIGGIYKFIHARIWVNKQVFGNLKGPGPLRRLLRKADRLGRLELTRGVHTVAPGVATVSTGLHAPGFQYVVIRNPGAVWVLASDIAPLYANFERRVPTGQTDNPTRTLGVQDTMLHLTDGALTRIIPGHDPRVYKKGGDHIELTGAPDNRDTGEPHRHAR